MPRVFVPQTRSSPAPPSSLSAGLQIMRPRGIYRTQAVLGGSDEGYEAHGQAVAVTNAKIWPGPQSSAPFLPNFNGLGRGAMPFRKGPGKL